MVHQISLRDIQQAQALLSQYLEPTPLVRNTWLSEEFQCQIYLKLENLQPIGAFKVRGALNRIAQLSESEKKKGVITSSFGNHAQGVAWAAKALGVSATIFMPETAPIMKVENTRKLGAQVILKGTSFQETYQEALEHQKKSGQIFVHAFNDPQIIAGQGCIGLEISNELRDADFVIGSIGGGGMMGGVGIAIKSMLPNCKIIGCQAQGANPMAKAFKLGQEVKIDTVKTFADGVAMARAEESMRKLLSDHLDAVLEANDEEIARAVLHLMENSGLIAEGAGAIPLAVLPQLRAQIQNRKVVLIISGGNIDVNILSRIIETGLVKEGRRIKIKAIVPDQPGYLGQLSKVVGEAGANILQALHDRDTTADTLDRVLIELTLETKGKQHSSQVIDQLKRNFDHIEVSR